MPVPGKFQSDNLFFPCILHVDDDIRLLNRHSVLRDIPLDLAPVVGIRHDVWQIFVMGFRGYRTVPGPSLSGGRRSVYILRRLPRIMFPAAPNCEPDVRTYGRSATFADGAREKMQEKQTWNVKYGKAKSAGVPN